METKYRIKFSKTGKMVFVGHLDLMNVFRRAIKRASLPIAFSKGFNPHQLLSFALPLPIGMEGLIEYADFSLTEVMPNETILEKLNEQMPDGIKVFDCYTLPVTEKASASLVNKALYEIKFERNINEAFYELFKKEEIFVTKKSKSKMVTVDIKPFVHQIDLIDDFTLKIVLATGSAVNLKPSDFCLCFDDFFNEHLKVIILRKELILD